MNVGIPSVLILSTAVLAGCSSLGESLENMESCAEDYGGTRAKCDELNAQRKIEASFEQREFERFQSEQSTRSWSAEASLARSTDRRAPLVEVWGPLNKKYGSPTLESFRLDGDEFLERSTTYLQEDSFDRATPFTGIPDKTFGRGKYRYTGGGCPLLACK